MSEQLQVASRSKNRSNDLAEFFKLPWYLLMPKTRRSNMIFFRSLVKELAVRAVFFPDD